MYKKPSCRQGWCDFNPLRILVVWQLLYIKIYLCRINMTKEQKTLEEIKRAFKHLEFIEQYKVGRYRLDLYFPGRRLAIECDEWDHKRYLPEKEKTRQDYIEQELDCTFVRYNPDSVNFHIGDVIHEIMLLV